MKHPSKFIIEGLDRLGKSTLIEGLRNQLGYYEVVHFGKPQQLTVYDEEATIEGETNKLRSFYLYQRASFENMMQLLSSEARIIFDRGHIGEVVYSPMYRNYVGDYVYNLERQYRIDRFSDCRLILLAEDFGIAKHFVDDGESLGPIEKRQEEQERFIQAFWKSGIKDKRVINVTDQSLGGFRRKEDILAQALSS